jgi:hypothetical protein
MRSAERIDPRILAQGGGGDQRAQNQPLKCAATAERHVHLSCGKRASGIHDHLVQSQSLALVDGDGPGESQRVLAEGAEDLSLDLAGILLEPVADVLPDFLMQRVVRSGVAERDRDLGSTDLPHGGEFAVVVGASLDVVADEHDLCADFDLEHSIAGIERLRELTGDLGRKGMRAVGERREFRCVDAVGLMVVGGQQDKAWLLRREVRIVTLPKQPLIVRIEPAMPDVLEEREKARIALTIDSLQLDARRIQLRPHESVEEVGTSIVVPQDSPFRLPRHRRQLMDVADEDHLYIAERLRDSSHFAQREVDRIEGIAARHADLVDDEQVELAKHSNLLRAQAQILSQQAAIRGDAGIHGIIGRHEASEWQAEHGMQGDAAGVDGRDAGRRHHHDVLLRALHELAQQARLARAGPPGHEAMLAGVQGELLGQLEFGVTHGDSVIGHAGGGRRDRHPRFRPAPRPWGGFYRPSAIRPAKWVP